MNNPHDKEIRKASIAEDLRNTPPKQVVGWVVRGHPHVFKTKAEAREAAGKRYVWCGVDLVRPIYK